MTTTQRGMTFHELCADAKTRIKEITKPELQQWLAEKAVGQDFVLVDVREKEENEKGAIPGAVHCSRGVLELNIDDVVPNQDQTVVLYCGGGNRSALSADMLQKMGYTNVLSLAGGWRGWNAP